MGKVIAILGGQWGDEGKGKVVDFLTEKADVVARAMGGNNAGHTVIVGDKKYKYHLLPSGIIHEDKLNICGNGMVIDPHVLVSEIENLEQQGFHISDKNLVISANAHIITKEHINADLHAGKKIGTTGRGIGPCYEDKVGRRGKLAYKFKHENTPEALKLRPLVKDTYNIINNAINDEKNVLIEGAQGTLLDIDHGTYPFVTSSHPTAGGACIGLGIGPKKITNVIAVMKAYLTRVGRGPFPTELGTDQQTQDEITWDEIKAYYDEQLAESLKQANDGDEYYQGKFMRIQGKEYGTTTGRARRTGWFDAVAAKYAVTINGLTSIILTKLDVLSKLDRLKICTAYKIDGEETTTFSPHLDWLEKAKPVYEEMPGWKQDLSVMGNYDELPKEAKEYIKKIEQLLGVPVSLVSVGPERTQTLVLKPEEFF